MTLVVKYQAGRSVVVHRAPLTTYRAIEERRPMAIDHYTNRVQCVCKYCSASFSMPACRLKVGMGHVCQACRHPSPADRFWRKVQKSDGCWLWTASRHPQGHGYASMDGRVQYAHRVSWTLTNGPVPEGLSVCHRCDNPPCVNPAHLFLGTHADNMGDMAQKGRAQAAALKRSKLRPEDVREIIRLRSDGLTLQAIADRFSVTPSAIGLITRGQRWGNGV